MDNYAIADQLSLLAKLMDIHGENSFKAKSYASAAFSIEKMEAQLEDMPREKIAGIRGIGDSVAKKVIEILDNGDLSSLQELLDQTPEGVLEMMNIKGLGPKKIHMIWKEMNISTIAELKLACQEKRLSPKKGFGEKTEQKILEAINFSSSNEGRFLYAQVEDFVGALNIKFFEKLTGKFEVTGDFKRQSEIVEKLEWVTTCTIAELKKFFDGENYSTISESGEYLELLMNDQVKIGFHLADEDNFCKKLFLTSSSPLFLQTVQASELKGSYQSESDIFNEKGMDYVPAFLREQEWVIEAAKKKKVPEVVQTSDIKGLIHSHSNWSDGGYTIEVMAKELIKQGYEYLVISDHSKAAFYANGLSEDRIRQQHLLIDELNQKFAPFRIFKSIECDILNDGTMDYSNEMLSTFDLVIASVHSNQNMKEEKAMTRLLGAINNPYVTILGHMTGRLLLKRQGYPVDHKAIIEACVENEVVIEINANPKRLDMDWRYVHDAIEAGAMLSIDPDAHTLDEFPFVHYGVLVAQKGGLTKERNLSSMGLKEFEAFIRNRKVKKGL
jgi:DNA polymerase (family X)